MELSELEKEYRDTISRLQDENARLKQELKEATRDKKADADEEMANHLLNKYGVKNTGEIAKKLPTL